MRIVPGKEEKMYISAKRKVYLKKTDVCMSVGGWGVFSLCPLLRDVPVPRLGTSPVSFVPGDSAGAGRGGQGQ